MVVMGSKLGADDALLGELLIEIDDILLERERNADCREEAIKRWVGSS